MRKDIFLVMAATTLFVGGLSPTVAATISHYERGRELFEMERWIDARNELQEALREEGDVRGLMGETIDYMLAVCSVELGLEIASYQLHQFDNQYPTNLYFNEVLYSRAIVETAEGDLDRAYEIFRDVDADRLSVEEREQYNLRMGYILFRRGDNQGSMHHFKQIKKESDFYQHALYFISYIAYEAKDYAQAKRGFEELLTLGDTYQSVLPFYMLQIEFDSENYQLAIDYGEKLLKQASPEQRESLVRTIAESYFRLDKYNQAISYIDSYAVAGGELGRAENYIKGFSFHQLKRYDVAIEYLKRACGADDAMTQNASFHLANCYLMTNDKEGALRAFSMASNDEFNEQIAQEALFNQAKLQYELGDGVFNETINLLTRYNDKYNDPTRRVVVQTLLAAAYYNSRDYSTAYDKISQIRNPDSEIKVAKQKIAYLRGLEEFAEGNYASAEKYLKESIEIGISSKQLALAYYWVGEIAFRRGDYASALKGYNYLVARTLKGDRQEIEAQFSIAYALLKQGNTTSALEYFKRYVALEGSVAELRADAYNRIGDIYYGERNYSQATSSYRSSIAIDGATNRNYSRYQIAIILGLEGKVEDKISALKQIVDIMDGEDYLDDSLYELGNTNIKSGNYTTAVKVFESFIEKYPRSPLYSQALSDMGVAYININDTKSALKYYDLAIKSAPQSQIAKDAMQGIREIYVGQGDVSSYFKYAESIGMNGDLTAVTRDSLSFASARGLYFDSEGSSTKQRKVVSSLNSYIKSYPSGYYLSDALFYLSDCHIKLGDNKSAISTLTALDKRGNNQYSESVNNMLSKLTFDEGQYVESAAASIKLFDVAKDQSTREEAMKLYVKATLATKDSKAIAEMSDEILSRGEASVGAEVTLDAIYIRATNLRERGERKEALTLYEQLTTRESAKRYKSESHYYIIDNAYRNGDHSGAESLIFELSDSGSADAYWLAKSFILLGDIYVAAGDNFQARATYQSIVDGYSVESDGLIEIAKRKISELK
ncbi:MAG: tetratricopeptide repeat protein [Rikenellaceae bacterium]